MTAAIDPPSGRGPLGALFDRLARPDLSGVPDGELLARFGRVGDEAAFAEVAHRHGAMVRGVARRVLRCESGADDVTQAAFVVLARRSGEFAGRGTVGDFLRGVARRLALKARVAAARRIEVERRAAKPEGTEAPREADAGFDADQLLARLPAKYRAAVVLCDLEGASRRDAASRLGVPEGTVSSRLDAAHKLLAARLHRLGVKLSVAAILAGAATSGAPAGLVRAATAAALITAGHAPGTVPAAVLALASGEVRVMTLAKLAAGLLAIGVAGGVTAVGVGQTSGGKSKPAEVAATAVSISPGQRASNRAGIVAQEVARLANGGWQLSLKTVNGKPAGTTDAPELAQLRFAEAAYDGGFRPANPADVARVFVSGPRFAGDAIKYDRLVAVKLNPHRTPRELTLVAARTDQMSPPPLAPPGPVPAGGAAAVVPVFAPPEVLVVPRFEFYLPCIYELDGDKLRLARYDGAGEADRPRGFKPEEQPPGAPDLIVLEFGRVDLQK